jgi:hypothetical protein
VPQRPHEAGRLANLDFIEGLVFDGLGHGLILRFPRDSVPTKDLSMSVCPATS